MSERFSRPLPVGGFYKVTLLSVACQSFFSIAVFLFTLQSDSRVTCWPAMCLSYTVSAAPIVTPSSWSILYLCTNHTLPHSCSPCSTKALHLIFPVLFDTCNLLVCHPSFTPIVSLPFHTFLSPLLSSGCSGISSPYLVIPHSCCRALASALSGRHSCWWHGKMIQTCKTHNGLIAYRNSHLMSSFIRLDDKTQSKEINIQRLYIPDRSQDYHQNN